VGGIEDVKLGLHQVFNGGQGRLPDVQHWIADRSGRAAAVPVPRAVPEFAPVRAAA